MGILGIGVQVSDPALLSQKIRAALAPCRLGEWPTPLEPAPALARALGVPDFRLKREDRASSQGGGNKVRGLEFLLARVPAGTVFVTAGGTGSTHCLATAVHAAGLVLAVAALRWPTRVVGVRVAPALVANRWRAMRLARAARRLLARHGVPLPAPRSPEIVNGLGRGYGWPTAPGERARRLAAAHGLTLDPTYGAKAFAFLVETATCKVQRVVFWP